MKTRNRMPTEPLALPMLIGAILAATPALGQDDQPAETRAPTLPEEAADTSTAAEEDGDRPAEGPGSAVSPTEYEPVSPLTREEIEGAQSFEEKLALHERDLAYFRDGAETFDIDMRDLIRIKYQEQRDRLSEQYDTQIDALETEERSRRLEAIARFEEFLRKYPNDPTYTPDAMFRLAELYFEKASDDYLIASRGYEAELQKFERGERPDEPVAPEPTYEKTIGLHQDLLVRFPSYRLADAARYLLGYCYGEQGQVDQALIAFRELVDKHPDSKFLAEVWTRIGEIHFDGNDAKALELAIDAYRRVRQFPDSPYYDKALYKIAWTYYRLDRYDEAVTSFIELVDYADTQKAKTGISGSELRTEAIQYIAISLADERWGGLDRAKNVLGPIEAKDYTGELWKRYGEILYDQTRYPQAIQVLGYTIEKYPTARYNPEAQEKIVRAYEQLRDFDGATAAREVLVKSFSAGSRWYEANRDDPEAIANAEGLTERSLYTAAIFRHQQAQAYKSQNRLDDAKKSYLAAAEAYQKYLERFPDSKNSYDFEFFLAECLYYSGDFMKAAAQYDKVRDSKLDNKHLEAAALSAVITYEKDVEDQIAQGKLPKLEVLTADKRKEKKIEARPLAPPYVKLVESSDRFTTMLPKSDRAPAIAYRAAEVFYKHDNLDEARARFEKIVQDHPGTDVARYSANLIIESYLAVEDWGNVEKVSKRLKDAVATAQKGETGDKKKFEEEMDKFRLGAQFKLAQQYEADGKFEEAADAYVRIVNENPSHEFADKSLFNAAISYAKVNRFDTASKMYKRIYEEYPKSDLAPRALFQEGINAEKGFDFPSAIDAYTKLVDRYPNSDKRPDALYNVAVVLENMQEYGRSADAFKKYAQTFSKRDDAGDVFFRAALVYEKMKSYPEMISTLDQFVAKYKGVPKQKDHIVQAYQKIGDAEAEQGNDKKALKAYQTCVGEFSRRKLNVQDKAGGFAAQCSLQIAEAKFREYDELQVTGTGKKLVDALTKKAKVQREVEKAYSDVFNYKRVEETLAASYRVGYSYERFADALFSAPIPPEIRGKPEFEDEYRAQLEEKAVVLEKKAETAYRKAYEEAKRTRVTNEWTQRILEGLNKYAKEEFPIQKQGKSMMQTDTISGNGLDDLGTSGRSPSRPGAQVIAPGGAQTAEVKP
jgi:TolA-binding protein